MPLTAYGSPHSHAFKVVRDPQIDAFVVCAVQSTQFLALTNSQRSNRVEEHASTHLVSMLKIFAEC
jgi:hypothetical protein